MQAPYREKPWWLRQITNEKVWVTIYPRIYVPVGLDPLSQPALCAHENVHLVRQGALGKWTWFWRYMTKKQFRLAEEILGIVDEIMVLPMNQRYDCIKRYAYQLSSASYHNAASSQRVAEDLIIQALAQRSQK